MSKEQDIIEFLSTHRSHYAVKDIAEQASASRSMVKRVVSLLEADKKVRRDPEDGRTESRYQWVEEKQTVTELPYTPQDVSDRDVMMGLDDTTRMPPYNDIPGEFRDSHNRWVRLSDTWFFKGLDAKRIKTKPGIDRLQALRFLTAIQRSFAPQHEHKSAAVAYLLSLWFEEVK